MSGSARLKPGFGEFQRGWAIVFSSFLGIGLGLSPLPFYTLGVFAPHLAKAFGWSMSQIMAGLSVTTLMVLWAGPLTGLLAVRYGVRRIALISLLLFSLSFMTLALSNGSLPLFYASWALVAITGAGTLPITWTRAVNHWFDTHKGLALGIALSGTGLFGVLCKPFLAWIIGNYGWRAGYVGLGLLPLLIAFPAAFLLFRDTDTSVDAVQQTTAPGGLTVAETLRDWRFWLIGLAMVPISLCLGGPVPNLEAILGGNHVDPGTIASLTPLVGLSAILGRLAGGWLMDRFWAPAVGFLILGIPAISLWLLARGTLDYPTAAAAILLVGFALGMEFDLMAFLIARYFGLRSYAAIFGILYVFFSLGGGFGPLVFGWAFDHYGNYQLALQTAAVTLVLTASTLLVLGRYRKFADEPIDDQA
ncbi:MFS transporter [Sphingomonas sp. 28-63-12]|uniref:MFS transporter n=1 Tax=Sphingomonas sp. 28-63-12 TaxID=1970434 RepID=UPI000BDA8681|nr:MAG: hypothetical protein B7Y47_02300 [Sphingomonas sp. 28-63-12]